MTREEGRKINCQLFLVLFIFLFVVGTFFIACAIGLIGYPIVTIIYGCILVGIA